MELAANEVALVKAELKRLRAYHNRDFKIFSANYPVRFAFTFVPSDPNFPYDIDGVRLRFTLPEGYPQEVCMVEAEESTLPAPLNKKLTTALNEQARVLHEKGKPVVLALLQWFDQRGLPTLLSDAQFLASTYLTQTLEGLSQRRYVLLDPASYAAKQHETSTVRPQADEESPAREDDDRLDSDESEDGADEDEDEDEEKEEQEEEGRGKRGDANSVASPALLQSVGNQSSSNASKAIDVQCSGLTLVNVGIVECVTLALVVTCYRCSKQSQTTILPGRTKNSECGGCGLPYTLLLKPLPVHKGSSLLGLLETDGCNPLDSLPSSFAGLCFECGERNVFSGLAFDRVTERMCSKCHARMALAIHHLSFHKKKKPPPPGLVIPDKAKKAVKIPGLKVGEPLPQNGACTHYTHSHRWLRFPCCGRAFPCDDCHNEALDHEAKWASKMICGFCASEQRCNELCGSCGKKVAGKGKIKDPTKMSKKDSKKFAGVCKTKSRKSERVGPKKLQ